MKDLETARFYSILTDESTDIATDHTLIIYACYVLDGCVSTKFLELTELPRGTAPAILQTLLKVTEEKKIPVGSLWHDNRWLQCYGRGAVWGNNMHETD